MSAFYLNLKFWETDALGWFRIIYQSYIGYNSAYIAEGLIGKPDKLALQCGKNVWVSGNNFP